MSYKLPSVEELLKLGTSDQQEVLAHLFERCETLNALVEERVLSPARHSSARYSSYPDLIESIRTELLSFLKANESDPRVDKIIAAHPRLGAARALSSHSQSEQASLQAAAAEETTKLADLNKRYEERFPGLRYVVFVNGRSRAVIMDNMEERIARGDLSAEKLEAFNAMCDIALDRASKLI